MASRKKQKYPNQKKTLTDARRYVIRSGEYNGSSASSDFMVTGHSTGSPYSEMEELSEQVSRDAGGFNYQEPEFADDRSDTGYEMYQGEGLGDLGGPELYGNRYEPKAPRSRGLMIGAAVGLAATALLGGLAYLVYNSDHEKTVRRSRKASGGRAIAKSAGKAIAARGDDSQSDDSQSDTAKPVAKARGRKTASASAASTSTSPKASKSRGKRTSSQARA